MKSVKIYFQLEDDTWHGHASESMWCEQVSEQVYTLSNIPCFAYGISLDDTFRAVQREDKLWFEHVIKRSGNSTYRILVLNNEEETKFEQYWNEIEKLGCNYESRKGPPMIYAVNVPNASDIHRVYALLEKGEVEGVWTFEEGFCGHVVN